MFGAEALLPYVVSDIFQDMGSAHGINTTSYLLLFRASSAFSSSWLLCIFDRGLKRPIILIVGKRASLIHHIGHVRQSGRRLVVFRWQSADPCFTVSFTSVHVCSGRFLTRTRVVMLNAKSRRK